MAVGYWNGPDDIERNWVLDREFVGQMPVDELRRRERQWGRAVERSLDWEAEPAEGAP
jgi:glycerol kinase